MEKSAGVRRLLALKLEEKGSFLVGLGKRPDQEGLYLHGSRSNRQMFAQALHTVERASKINSYAWKGKGRPGYTQIRKDGPY